MTREDKELLLKDLCARLPYRDNLIVAKFIEQEGKVSSLYPEVKYSIRLLEFSYLNSEFIIKPYLRPMSSMTEEEKKIYELYHSHSDNMNDCPWFDWLNAHHFDYRGLIEKGLALEAPEGMYHIK